MKNIDLSVVIPAYREAGNIENGSLEEVWNYLKRQKYSWEVLIVDDGSPDKTAELVEKFIQKHKGFKLLREPHRGKGGTVIAGMLEANGKIIVFTDMDQATPIEELEKILPEFDKGFDIVIGSRAGREGAPISRKVMAYGFMTLRTIILRLPYKDTQCGFKGFTRSAAKDVFSKMKVFSEKMRISSASVTAGFDLEMLYIARKLGLSVSEIPVTWHHKGSIRVNPLLDSWHGLRDLIKVRINAIEGKYNV